MNDGVYLLDEDAFLDFVDTCPSGALTYDHCFEHNPVECMNCESCELICEYGAITINNGVI